MSISPDTIEFSHWLRSQCDELGITQKELSRQLRISKTSVRLWWRGEVRPYSQNIFKIIQVFEILGGEKIDLSTLPFHLTACETPTNSAFGRWIVMRLGQSRLSMWRLSQEIDIQDETMRQWIIGNVQPNLLNLMRIVEFFSDGDPRPVLLEAYDAILEDADED